MTTSGLARCITVAVIVHDEFCPLDFGVVAGVFGLDRPVGASGWYRLMTCAPEPGCFRTAQGLKVEVDQGLECLEAADMIVLPGWRGVDALPSTALLERLRSASARGARIVALHAGAFLLASAGLLERCAATIHWSDAEAFKTAYPRVQLQPDVLYVDQGAILTSAGSAAGMDLLLHIVRQDFGSEIANRVAKQLVTSAHRAGGQAQLISRPVARDRNSRMAALLDWITDHVEETMTIAALARRAAMSERTFLRRFRDLTGTTPVGWILAIRLDRAKEMLEQGRLSVEDVASQAGFRTSSTLRAHFRAVVGASPREYRKRFVASRAPSQGESGHRGSCAGTRSIGEGHISAPNRVDLPPAHGPSR